MSYCRNLSEALLCRNLEMIQYYLAHDDMVQVPQNHWDYLVEAIKSGSPNIVEAVSVKIDVASRDRRETTALHMATCFGHEQIVQYLLAFASIDVDAADADGMTALHWACYWGNFEITWTLLQRNANHLATNKRSQTPSMVAEERGHTVLAQNMEKYATYMATCRGDQQLLCSRRSSLTCCGELDFRYEVETVAPSAMGNDDDRMRSSACGMHKMIEQQTKMLEQLHEAMNHVVRHRNSQPNYDDENVVVPHKSAAEEYRLTLQDNTLALRDLAEAVRQQTSTLNECISCLKQVISRLPSSPRAEVGANTNVSTALATCRREKSDTALNCRREESNAPVIRQRKSFSGQTSKAI